MPPVVIAIAVLGGVTVPAIRGASVPLVVARVVVARVKIEHDVLREIALQCGHVHCLRRIVGSRVELDVGLPEGASVTVLVKEGDGTFEADPETERMLLEAIAQCDRGERTPLAQFLEELRREK